MLVAIAIPIFTAQLEKSREAVDLANMRSAYAQVQAAGLTEAPQDELKANETDKIKYTASGSGSSYQAQATITYGQSDTNTWKTANPSCGGVQLSDTPGTSCTITYTASDGKTAISNAKTTTTTP